MPQFACLSSRPMPPVISDPRIVYRIAVKFGTSFVHTYRTTVEYLSIKGCNGSLGFRRMRHLNKCNTARLTSIPVLDDGDGFYGPVCCKHFSELLLCHRDVKVPNKNVGHKLIAATDLAECFATKIEAEFQKAISTDIAFRKEPSTQTACTFSACQPFGPLVTSNCTV